jgi:hypothetical protein
MNFKSMTVRPPKVETVGGFDISKNAVPTRFIKPPSLVTILFA